MDRDRGAWHLLGESPRRGPAGVAEALQAARRGRDESAWTWVGEDDDQRALAHAERLDCSWEQVDAHAEENAERIARLAADVDIHLRLALIGFTGREYEEFKNELTRYGLDVMTGWLRTGKIFTKMREAGFGLPLPPDGALDRDAQDELAGETVTMALYRFHHDVLLGRRWDPSKGARLTTFFIGQCKIRFANIYRAWLDKEVPSKMLFDPAADDSLLDSMAPAVDSPEWKAVARSYVRRGVRAINDHRVHRALEMIARDRPQSEIARELGMTEKAVERMLANQRARIVKLGIA
jgi:DNA-binding phage protein